MSNIQTVTVTRSAPQVVVVRPLSQVQTSVPGIQGATGPQGTPGASGEATGRAVVAFSFGDASPAPIFTPAVNCTDVLVRLVIDTPFNGVGAALKLGTSADPESLLAAADNDPTTASGYEAAPDKTINSGTPIVLTIIPGTGATQGAGRIVFDAIAA